MIEVARSKDGLVVSEGPSRVHRFATWVCLGSAVLVLMLGAGGIGIGGGIYAVGMILAGVVLVWNWTTTAYHFDRGAGTLVIAKSAPGRAAQKRDVALGTVAAVLDRRAGTRKRAIELVLDDRTTLVVARGSAKSEVLDSVAREIGELLKKPVHLAQAAVIADRFEIERLAESGGMGAVYRAVDRTTGAPVAVKLALDHARDERQAARFAREMQLLAALDHPRICGYVSHGVTADGRAYLVMQWLSGEDLRARLGRGPLPLEDALHVLKGAAEAIAVVHGQGIVHRDLKPGNLFLRDASPTDVVLLDFGIARRFESDTRLTGSKTIVGTPHYMAPEQASSGTTVTPAADVFSLGCIFYECLTGQHPFDAGQLVGVLARILFDNPETIESICPNIPKEWASLLNAMLSKDPAQRPADGNELLTRVLQLPLATGEVSTTNGSVRGDADTALLQLDRDSGDQVLVSVVLATLDTSEAGPAAPPARLDEIREAMDSFGCSLERLADGSLLASVSPRHTATDQVRIAARAALYLRDAVPHAKIAVATGRAPLRRTARVGDAVDRALVLLETVSERDAVRLDTVTAGLLAGHFVTIDRDGAHLLVGEREELDESRLLLGKPTPCVGREPELGQLESVVSGSIEGSAPKAGLVLGPPGIGKSRLRHELLRRLRAQHPEAAYLVGFGDPLSARSPHVLLADALRRHAAIRAGDDPVVAREAITAKLCARVDEARKKRVSEFLGELCSIPFPAEGSPPLQAARNDHRVMSEQITLAFVDWLSAECSAHPVTFVLDDVQWGDALTLKLLETAMRDLKQAPLSVLAFGRPETLETFPKLLGSPSLSLSLGALTDKASELLVRRVLGAEVTTDSLKRIVKLAGGNALFLEELIRAGAEGKAGDVPETVLAILQARFSRLSPEQRLTLRAASVIGERFWQSGVAEIAAAWSTVLDSGALLASLVDSELVERARTSRFSDDTEYFFRHALVCDAAYGLLADADRRTAHAAAGVWLEGEGEGDGAVLARHAEEAGDTDRALRFYSRASQQSLSQYDFAEALRRAEKGIACGAAGVTLGVLQSIQAAAYYSMGQWNETAALGMSSLALLPRGGALWCSTVEKLLQVLPNVGDPKAAADLAQDLLEIEPSMEAREAYLNALHPQLLAYSVGGSHARGHEALAFIDRLGKAFTEPDAASRGLARLWRGIFTFILTDDMQRALELSTEAVRDLTESQVLHRLSLAHVNEGFVLWGLGDIQGSERATRRARAVAAQIHDDYHFALAGWYLALALTDTSDPLLWNEAEDLAHGFRLAENPMFEGTALSLTARVSFMRGDLGSAVADGSKARAILHEMVPYALLASDTVVRALAAQGRWDEACAIAREDLGAIARVGGAMFSDVLVRVAAAEALFGGGFEAESTVALEGALAQIDARARKITSPELRRSFLVKRPENVRAADLAAKLRVR